MSNIVLLMSDEHNPFYSSVYGHATIQTPNLARMADQGTVFRNAYCPSPLCGPSRSAFMSGKRVFEIQTYSNSDICLNPNHQSYGAALVANGVHVTHVGKTDVYDKGENLGFSEMLLPKDTHFPDVEIGRNPLMTLSGAADRGSGFGPRDNPWELDDLRTDTAISWLKNKAPQIESEWVLVLNLLNPHFPHYTTPELWEMYPNGDDLPPYGLEETTAQHPYAQDLREYFDTAKFTEDQIRGLRRGYLGCVTYIDQQIGRLMNTLEALELSDHTNMIYVSDHGEMLGKFGLWWKCSMYEDSIRVPCIAMGPDFSSSKIVETPVDLFDVQAALFKSVGAERPSSWIGQPLQEITDNDPNRVIFSEYHGHGTRASAFMVRKGDWKYIHYIAGPNQLFDLSKDPDELNNIIDTHQDVALELERDLRQICSPELENERAEKFIGHQLASIGLMGE